MTTTYEVKTPDGLVHRIEALTHVHDSNGLTLYASAGAVVAIFPKFEWMRQDHVVAETPTVPDVPAAGAGTSTPVASGE